MKRFGFAVASLLLAIILYFLFWPVPVDPVAWDAPVDRGMVDPFGADRRLRRTRAIDLGRFHGPEDVTAGHDGQLYATSSDGFIVRIDGRGSVSEFASTGGRPLGIETDADGSFLVANAYTGLQRVSPDGSVTALLGEVNGQPLMYANDVAIADDGTVYLTEATTKFSAQQVGGTYEGSLLDVLEHGSHGQVIRFNPDSGEVQVILDQLNFANGIAISEDQSFLLISDLGSYRILKHWLLGPNRGRTDVLLDNLPAFADNINNGRDGRFWIGMISPRSAILDRLSNKPFLRKMLQRLPSALRPGVEPYSHVVAINGDGEVLINLRDPAARYPSLTGVFETNDTLYLATLFGNQLPLLKKDNL